MHKVKVIWDIIIGKQCSIYHACLVEKIGVQDDDWYFFVLNIYELKAPELSSTEHQMCKSNAINFIFLAVLII